MDKNQAVALSQAAYLNKPPSASTLGKLAKHYLGHKDEIPANNEKERKIFEKALNTIKDDPYLSDLNITGYQNNNDKSGFVGYAFEAPSGDGVVSFRGSEGLDKFFEGNNRADWINNLSMETGPFSAQELDARAFLQDKNNGAGNLKSIDFTGHSLGGYLA